MPPRVLGQGNPNRYRPLAGCFRLLTSSPPPPSFLAIVYQSMHTVSCVYTPDEIYSITKNNFEEEKKRGGGGKGKIPKKRPTT